MKRFTVLLLLLLLLSGRLALSDERGGFVAPDFYEPEETTATKSITRAYLYSLLLPGLGHQYLGDKSTARAFYISEASIWTTFLAFFSYGQWQEEKYENWAARYAGVNKPGEKGELFYDRVKEYQSRDFYNWITYLVNEDEDQLYPATKAWYWKWETDARRKEFKNILLSSIGSHKNARLCLGAAILNRLLSILDLYGKARHFGSSAGDFSVKLKSSDIDADRVNMFLLYSTKF